MAMETQWIEKKIMRRALNLKFKGARPILPGENSVYLK
jgi:hypothetical protein